MTAAVETRRATSPTEKSSQAKRLSRQTHNHRKPLYSAVFATLASRRKAKTASWNCINNLKIIDPACGCGNFLIIAYRELRMLELTVIKALGGKEQYVQSRIVGGRRFPWRHH